MSAPMRSRNDVDRGAAGRRAFSSPAAGPACAQRSAGGLLLALLVLAGCGEPATDSGLTDRAAGNSGPAESRSVDALRFEDVSEIVGLDFVHENGMSGRMFFVEPVGAGGGLADFDGDGDLDLILVQGQVLPLPEEDKRDPERVTRVFRNDLIGPDGTRGPLQFTDITASSGLHANGYGMGVAIGDVDNDGRADVYVTNFGENRFFRNVSGAQGIRFEDRTEASGADDRGWSTSAAFADLDEDGWLDLYIANYVEYRIGNHKDCRTPGGRLNYCGPQTYEGAPDRLLRNLGGFRFEDISGPSGVLGAPSPGLGVVAADLDRDGYQDLYVANDMRSNFFWRSLGQRPMAFEDLGLFSGSAVAMDGRAQASMGLLAGDVDNDGDDDLFMTHLRADTNTLYLNDGQGGFTDASLRSGLGGASLQATGFGTVFIDIDNDGWLDVVAANGAVTIIEEQAAAGDPYPLKQPNQAFYNTGGGQFVEITETIGGNLELLEVSRGLAVGDIDNDGRSDLLLTNNQGPARLLLNRSETDHHWLGLSLLTADSGRDALGAQVRVTRSDGVVLWRRAATDGSYLSSNDPRVLVGLGEFGEPVEVQVRWPGGSVDVWSGLETDRYHRLMQGAGRSEESE
jgi:hypothetical protein